MIRRHTALLRLALGSADALSAVVLFLLVTVVRFHGEDTTFFWTSLGVDPRLAAGVYGLGWVGALWTQGVYRPRARWTPRSELLDIVRATILISAATLSLLFLAHLPDVSRLFLFLLFLSQPVVTFASRLILRSLLVWLRERGLNSRFMIVVGAGPEADAFADRIEHHPALGLRVLGHLLAPGETATPRRPVLGNAEDLEAVLHVQVVDEVAVILPPDSWHLIEPISQLCEEEGRIVRIPLGSVGPTLSGGRVEELDGEPVLSLLHGPDRVMGLAAKRLLDLLLAGLALVVLSPVFLIVYLWIRINDGTPVFFRQTRIGLHGRPFQVLKFRTMIRDAEAHLTELEELNEINGHAFKVTNDPRLTPTGRWLRKTSLDELPQIWNVLIGQMSLVGPRPPLPREVAKYDIWHRRRLAMKPGITGLWQVTARSDGDFDRWVEIDLDYIDRWSLWLDVKIMLRTIPVMVLGQGR